MGSMVWCLWGRYCSSPSGLPDEALTPPVEALEPTRRVQIILDLRRMCTGSKTIQKTLFVLGRFRP